MKEEFTNPKIAEVISKQFLPGTKEDYDNIIDVEEFVELWEDEERPILSEIEQAMQELGFKDEKSRIDFGFYIRFQKEEEVE